MKLLLINSSGRTAGNTARVMDLLEQNFMKIARETALDLTCERISLTQLSLKPCIGCRACFDRGESSCPQQDDLLMLYEKMREADGYVIASPIYVEDVNGILKTMIDRMAFLCHRPALYGKSALLFTTSGIGSSRHALTTMTKGFGTWGIKTAATMQFSLGALTAREEVAVRYEKKIQANRPQVFACTGAKSVSSVLLFLDRVHRPAGVVEQKDSRSRHGRLPLLA